MKEEKFKAHAFAIPSTTNVGCTNVGDKTLCLSKNGEKITLVESEIKELLSVLAFFDPRLY